MKKYKCKRLSKPQAICQIEKHENGLLITGFEGDSVFVEMADDEPTSDEACRGAQMVFFELIDALWFYNFRYDIRVYTKYGGYSSDTEFDLKWNKDEHDRIYNEGFEAGKKERK